MPNAFQFQTFFNRPPAKSPDTNQRAIAQGGQSQRTRDNLEMLMKQIDHARRDAGQMMEDVAALEVDAVRANSLRRENDSLRVQLDDQTREAKAETAKSECAAREINRLKEDLIHIRADYEKSQNEASASKLDAKKVGDRLRAALASLDETKRDLELQREAKDQAEIDAACLRANLAEREREHSKLLQKEAELQMLATSLQSQYDDAIEALASKERSIIEKVSQIEGQKERIADLEVDSHAMRDELRSMGNKYADLKIAQEAKLNLIYDGLNQERENHLTTRKLLEQARSSNEILNGEIADLKDRELCTSKDQQRAQRDLSSARAQAREYGDKLKEAHLRLAAAEGEIQSLQSSLEDARNDATDLRRQACKSDQLHHENADLHREVKSLQRLSDLNLGDTLIEDDQAMISTAQRPATPPASLQPAAPQRVTMPGQNVARIARR